MNCSNCGGPMELVEGRHYLSCRYCSTIGFPTELEDSSDRIKSLESLSDCSCPHCNIQLSEGLIEKVKVDYCEQCRGLLVSSPAFAQIVKQRRAEHRGPDDSPQPLKSDELNRRLNCPSCEQRMEVHPYYGPGNAVVDSCHRCELIWLDHGELGAIERAPGKRER